MARHVALALAALALVPAAGCRDDLLQPATSELRWQPESMEVEAYVGEQVELVAQVFVSGSASLEPTWTVPGGPFEVSTSTRLDPGITDVPIQFRSAEAGSSTASVSVEAEGRSAVLTLTVRVVPPPECRPSGPCQAARFDLGSRACVESPKEEGATCDPASACVLAATCQAGRCLGAERRCDDGDACTLDVCRAETGCEHPLAPPCPGDGSCRMGVCDPAIGCTLSPAQDGTRCGPARTCDAVDVCIAGSCVQRDPPDGYVCAPRSPCQAEGRCVGSTCQRSSAVPMRSSWSFDASGARPEPLDLHDFVLEPDGTLSLMGFFEVPRIRANAGAPKLGITAARRCILWNAQLVCADYPYHGSGKVSAIDPSSGATIWTLDLPAQRPDFAAAALPGHLFLARLAVMGSDRLVALFEAYPANTSLPTLCRRYFFAIVDPSGRMVASDPIDHPLLAACNHPHPYGVASDVQGNLFITFSPSLEGGAPLTPVSPSLFVSYTRDGRRRWERTENIVGGELAVARGQLYPERASASLSAATGAPLQMGTGAMFGRLVATVDRVIPSPVRGGTSLRGFEAATGQARWSYAPAGTFLSDQVRLAGFRATASSPPASVALVFVDRGGQPSLVAVDARHGTEEWTCPLDTVWRTAPQLLEVADGSIALMEGSDQCGSCDPPFAQSQAAFHRIETPFLDVAREPWVGTFGGAGHDHHEDVPITPVWPR